MEHISYPKTRLEHRTEVLHGLTIADPYRWLEEDTPEVRSWEEQQHLLTNQILESWPDRERLRQSIYRSLSENSPHLPVFSGQCVFQMERLAGQQHPVLFVTDQESGERRILINPNNMSEQTELDWFYPSPDGAYVAYGISHDGDEQSELHIIETKTGNVLPDCIPYTSFAQISWLPDASGFYYSGGRASDFEDAEKWIFFHRLGDRTKKSPEPVRFFDPYVSPQLSPDGRYLVVNSSWEKPCAVYYKDRWGDDTWKPFLKGREGESYGHFYGNHFLALITDGAPRGKILSIPMDTIENKNTWKEIVTESEAVLRQFIVIGDNLVLSELYHAHSRLRVISLENGREEIVQLPGMGLIASDGAPDCCPFSAEGDNIYFCYETFVQPSCVYTYNLKTKELKDQGKAPESDLSRITVRQVYYPAKDGAQVPLYLVYKHDLDLTRPHPVLLHGYGGWNINPAPAYIGTGRTCVLPVVEAGGIYAFACLRGGCELGRKWWQDGRREKKQNTFDDFYAAAEYLIREGMTSPEQLAVIGASNGGLLTAVAVTQRPDLFQVVVSEVPLTDMIRALKDPYLSSYTEEYCDPGDPEMLPVLMSYSPLHHIKAGSAYPATFVLSGKNDVRCQPWNGRKLAAHLQNATRSEAPILLRVASGGHGPGLSLQEEVERRTDILGFIMQHLEMSVALD